MKLYAVRKRLGRWAVCSDDSVVFQFETYDEAIEIAMRAAEVMIGRLQPVQDKVQFTELE